MPDVPVEVKPEERRRHGGHFLLPAGALIGLGAGMLAGQPAAGVLIGLGLGFLGSALLPTGSSPSGGVATVLMHGKGWIPAIVGVFLIIVGLSILRGTVLPWTTIIAVLFILFGFWFILRGFGRAG